MPKQKTILIIDDELALQEVLEEFLSEAGYSVIMSGNGRSGYQCAQFTRPDLILLDVAMPGIDGYETCRMLRRRAATMYTPIFFMTANSTEQSMVEGFEAGGDRYITKPYRPEDVLEVIKHRFSRPDLDLLDPLWQVKQHLRYL
jgi:DNA-binding response OmpR family regulator